MEQSISASPQYLRVTALLINHYLATGSVPSGFQLTDSFLHEHNTLMNMANSSHNHLQPSTSGVAYESGGNDLPRTFGHVNISSPSGPSITSINPNAGLNISYAMKDEGYQTRESGVVLVGQVFVPDGRCEVPLAHILEVPGRPFDNAGGERETEEIIRALASHDSIARHNDQREGWDDTIDDKKCAIQDQRRAEIIPILASLFNKKEQYRQFLRRLRSNNQTQALLDLFQKLLDTLPVEDKLKPHLLVATQRLSKTTGFYPVCLSLRDVALVVNSPLASGSFANIYKGSFEGQHVCLKLIRLYECSEVQSLLKRIYPEAILWEQLKHPNILQFCGVYQLGPQLCLVSPWAENGDANTYLKHNPLVDRVRLSLDFAYGVAYLHENNIIHGDLKGANTLVNKSGTGVVADFGLSAVTGSQIIKWTSHPSAESTGGTIRWQAPELFGIGTDEIVHNSKASDIYALTCVLYEIFTGEVPFFEFRLDCTVMYQVPHGKRPSRPVPSSPSWSAWGLTERIWALMEDCWATEPAARPKIQEFIERLSEEVIGVDERNTSYETISPPHFRQNAGRQHPDYPTVSELQTLLWGESSHTAISG